MKKIVLFPLTILSLFAFLVLCADVGNASPKFNVDLEIIDRTENAESVTLTLNIKLINNLVENISNVTLYIISPIDLDESYGEVLVGDISATDFASLQATFDIPQYIDKIFDKKQRYYFKVKYYDSLLIEKFYIVRAVPEI